MHSNVFLNQCAVGDVNGKIEFRTFSGLPHGYSSISSLERKDFSVITTPITTKNDYIDRMKINNVHFIKCDVEGEELLFPTGSTCLFLLDIPLIWVFEMNNKTSKAFNYLPKEILIFLRNLHDYEFFRITDPSGRLVKMKNFEDYKHGDNVLCLISEFHADRFTDDLVID